MLPFLPENPKDVMIELRTRFKQKRQSLGFTQKELSSRAGVSLGSLKRFETSGQISLESLLKLALVLECLGDFDGVCGEEEEERFESIDDVLVK